MIVNQSLRYTSYLSEECVVGGNPQSLLYQGSMKRSPTKSGLLLNDGHFSQVIGDYYGRKYFKRRKRRQTHGSMIAAHQDRLRNNTWLVETRQKRSSN